MISNEPPRTSTGCSHVSTSISRTKNARNTSRSCPSHLHPAPLEPATLGVVHMWPTVFFSALWACKTYTGLTIRRPVVLFKAQLLFDTSILLGGAAETGEGVCAVDQAVVGAPSLPAGWDETGPSGRRHGDVVPVGGEPGWTGVLLLRSLGVTEIARCGISGLAPLTVTRER